MQWSLACIRYFFSYSIVLRRARFNFITPTRARHNPQSQVIMYIICTLKCMHYEGNLQITFIQFDESNYIRTVLDIIIALVICNSIDTLFQVPESHRRFRLICFTNSNKLYTIKRLKKIWIALNYLISHSESEDRFCSHVSARYLTSDAGEEKVD